MVVRTKKAYDGVNGCKYQTEWKEREVECDVDANGLPGGSIKVESEPWHQDGENNETKGDTLLWPFELDGFLRRSHTGR